MKKILIIFSMFAFAFQACNKDEAATAGLDFSNSLAPYVEVSATAPAAGIISAKEVEVKQGSAATVSFVMRTAFQEAVTVTYNVVGGGLNLTNQTVVIDRNKLNASATVNIPATAIVAPSTTATATLTLVKAVTASGIELTIGQKNDAAKQKVIIDIVK